MWATQLTHLQKQLPVLLQQRESVVGWGTLFLQVIRKDLPAEVISIDEDERDSNSWVKCKKWSYANLYRLFSKYVINTRLSDKENQYKEFGEMFINNFVPEILKAYFEQIQGWIEKRIWISKASLYNILSFFEECIAMKSTWLLLKPHSEILVNYVIFPLLCPSDSDLEMFEAEPEEYIHERIDIFEESPTPDIAATNFLLRLVRKRKKTVFTPILNFIQGIVQEHVANQADLELSRKKEGALRMLGSISYIVLSKKSPIADQMETFLVQYVFPDFSSPFGFLRARACEFLNRYAELEFKSQENISIVYQNVLKCMNDEHLPVQVEAALALQPMIRHDGIRAALSTKIPEVMQHLLNLGNKIDIDALSGVMEEFVEVFSEQLTPFSVQLAEQMKDQFIRIAGELLEKYNNGGADLIGGGSFDESGTEDKTMAALGILNTLTSLLLALDNASDIVHKLELVFMPIFALVLGNEMSEFYSEVWGLAENITFTIKAISPNMWQVYKLIHKSLRDFGFDYLEEVLPCLSNYIQYGIDGLISNSENLSLMYEIIEHVMTDHESLGAADRTVACNLAIRLLTASKGHIDEYVPRLLELAITRLQSNESQLKIVSYNVYLLEVVIASLYYNPHATLMYLETKQYTQGFFTSWFEKMEKFARVQDKKVSILALLGIFTLPDEQIPESIRNNLPQLSKALISIISTLPTAVENKEKLAKEYDSIDAGFDDDLYSTGLDDDEWADDDEATSSTALDTSHNDDDVDEPAAAEYLDYLSSEAIKLDSHEFYDKDDEELEEEVFEETPLDPVNAYIIFRDTLLNLNQTNQQRYLLLTSQYTNEDKTIVDKTFELASRTENKQH